MGVTGLWKLLSPAQETTTFAHLADAGFRSSPGRRGYRIGIDASLWLYHARTTLGAMGRDTVGSHAALRALFYRILSLLREGLLPLVVFDGSGGPARKRNKSGLAKGRADPLARGFMECCDLLGVRWIKADGEAEAELAAMGRRGELDGCLSDDVDTLVFGAPVVIRNLSATLSGHVFSLSQSSDSTRTSSYGKHSLAIYNSSTVQSTTSLTRSALILIALISGGDYLPEGIPRAGPTTTLALAKLGFGEKLLKGLARHRKSDSGREAFLQGWREEIAVELESNASGFLSRREKALASRVRAEKSFPCLQAVADYESPVVSDCAREVDWCGAVDMSRLVGWCSDKFEWPVEEIVDRLRNCLWPVLARQHLRLVALAQDGALPRTISSPLASAKLLLAVHDKKTSDSTSFVPAYRVELDPAPLLGMIVPHLPNPDPHAVAEDDPRRVGLEGTSPGKKAKLKVLEKTGRASCSHWIGVEWVHFAGQGKRLAQEWRERGEEKDRKKAEVEERRRMREEGRASPAKPKERVTAKASRPRPPPPADSDSDDELPARLVFSTESSSAHSKRAHTPTPPPDLASATSRAQSKSPRKVAPPARPSKPHAGTIFLDLSGSDLDSDDLPERLEIPVRHSNETRSKPAARRLAREPTPTAVKGPTKKTVAVQVLDLTSD